jgi:hypothetical protein
MTAANEPVAWMEYIQGEEWEVWFVEPTNLPKGHTYKPLYTHPVKELTDEEIISEWIGNDRNYYNFARAILKKAQEK